MGCISSKALTRSMSLQHQMSIKFQKTTDSLTKLDDLFTNSSKPALDSSNTSTTVNIWELLNKLEEQQPPPEEEEQEQEKPPEEEFKNNLSKRSKSFHTIEEFDNIEKLRDDSVGKSRLRSRSFHTVEEFDALLEKLKAIEDNPVENKAENGVKRKAYTKGLKSLQIPSNVEFPKPGGLRQWLGGKVCSPGAYVTPKFGSYNIQGPSSGGSSCDEGSVFLPDLVASLEEGMQQMEEEEKLILQQMDGVAV